MEKPVKTARDKNRVALQIDDQVVIPWFGTIKTIARMTREGPYVYLYFKEGQYAFASQVTRRQAK